MFSLACTRIYSSSGRQSMFDICFLLPLSRGRLAILGCVTDGDVGYDDVFFHDVHYHGFLFAMTFFFSMSFIMAFVRRTTAEQRTKNSKLTETKRWT